MNHSVQALILAAGRGSRLRPHTDASPKCLLNFGGHRLIDWQMTALRANGIDEVGIVCGYLGERFDALKLKTWRNSRWNETNMVYSLLCARELLELCDHLIVSYGDIIYEPRVVKALLGATGDIITVVDRQWLSLWKARFTNPLEEAESLRMDDGHRLTEIGRKAVAVEDIEAQYIGLLRFSRSGIKTFLDFFDKADPGAPWLMGRSREQCHMTDMLRGMIQAGHKVVGAVVESGWLEFDTVADYDLYNRLLAENRLRPFFCS